MKCPNCGSGDTKVKDSRPKKTAYNYYAKSDLEQLVWQADYRVRSHVCRACGKCFLTAEVYMENLTKGMQT